MSDFKAKMHQGGETSITWGETSRVRNVLGAKRLGGELTKGQNVHKSAVFSHTCVIISIIMIT